MIGTTIAQSIATIAAAVAAIGFWLFMWGFVNYIFAGRNELELAPARVHITRGSTIVVTAFVAWVIARLLLRLAGISLY